MLGTSTAELIFIRACIIGLSSVIPITSAYTLLALTVLPSSLRLPLPAELWFVAELIFYFGFFLPRKTRLQKPAEYPRRTTPSERRELFERTSALVTDPEAYISKWFHDAPVSQIRRDNVKLFFCWAFLDAAAPADQAEDEELDFYVREYEKTLQKPLEPGFNPAVKCVRTTLDPVKMSHRSLIWYSMVQFVDLLSSLRMLFYGFRHFTTPGFLNVLPVRPHAIFSSDSPAKNVSYWYRAHTSTTKLPIVFLHGLGIGIYPYVPFYAELAAADEDVGIFVVESMPISMRICHDPLTAEDTCAQIQQILQHHSVGKFVLVSHSYGTVVSAYLLRSPIADQIDSILLIDPVAFLLHFPQVAYNFTAREPTTANEHQLQYFASLDPGIAHTISRHFFWAEGILWKEELEGKRTAVSLGARDLLTDTAAVWGYLTEEEVPGKEEEVGVWRGRDSNGGNGKEGRAENWVLWYRDCDHGQVFDTKERRARLVRIVSGFVRGEDTGKLM